MNYERIRLVGVVALALAGIVVAQGMVGNNGSGSQSGNGMGYRGNMMGGGMMALYSAQAQPLSQAELQRQLEAFAQRYGSGARLKDLMPFSENTYAQVVDAKGQGLREIIVNRYTGVVMPEPGPNIMWNTRYGMGYGGGYGMMGGYAQGQNQTPPAPRYDQAAAQKLAETFLAGYLPGAKVMEAQAFPGYYTLDYGRTAIEGMLSVNAYTGEVCLHTWHGIYLGAK